MTPASPGRVLRRSLLAWGLGERDLHRPRSATAWLLAELIGLGVVAYLTVSLADTTLHLVPFLAGVVFVAVWGWQAVAAYRRAQRTHGAIAPPSSGSPAIAMAWLALPLLAWGAGFWIIAAGAASPAATLDRLVAEWSDVRGPDAQSTTVDPLDSAIASLVELCASGRLARDCASDPEELFRDVRFSIVSADQERATAVAEAIDLTRRPTRFLGIIETTESVPVARQTILRIGLAARAALLPQWIDIGARRWEVVSLRPG